MEKRYFNSCFMKEFYQKWCSKISVDLQKEFEEDVYNADEMIQEWHEELLWEQRAGEDV